MDLKEALKNYFTTPSPTAALDLSVILAKYKSSDALTIFSDTKKEMGVV